MSEEAIQREYYCNFEAYKYKKIVETNILTKQINICFNEKRICKVPYQNNYQVDTYWDIGLLDYTAILFV